MERGPNLAGGSFSEKQPLDGDVYEPPQGEIEGILATVWEQVLRVSRVGRNQNFFESGGNSLRALEALAQINQHCGGGLTVADAYMNPTIRELAAALGGNLIEDGLVDLEQEAVLDEQITAHAGQCRNPAKHILLTGGTGFVGRFLLVQLLQDTDATVHCLVRPGSARPGFVRLRETLHRWGLWRDEFAGRIVGVAGDLRLPQLGIGERPYRELCERIDSVYHCATSMNHLETYAMAKSANVDAVAELLRLATQAAPKSVNYISTLSIFKGGAQGEGRVVDEFTSIDHERHRNSQGYSASKWVGEKIFMTACERGIPCNIFRLGLIWADTRQGRYDELQHAYRLLKSCLLSGRGIEDYCYYPPPTPVDYAARAVVSLASRHVEGSGIFHISSPGPTIEGTFERCNEILGTSLRLVPYYDWVQEIRRLHSDGRSLPIVPVLEYAFSLSEAAFYEHQCDMRLETPRFDAARTQQELEQAGIVAPPVDDELLRVCVEGMLTWDPELTRLAEGYRLRRAVSLKS